MNTLRQLREFVHLDSTTFQPMGPTTSLRNVANWVANPVVPVAMRQVIQKLEQLPPWSWQASVTPTSGIVPFTISVTKKYGPGIHFGGAPARIVRNGQEVALINLDFFNFSIAEPGDYRVERKLVAITNVGYQEENNVIQVSAVGGGTGQPGGPGGQSQNKVNMIVTAQPGIAIIDAEFKLEGPGAPSGTVKGVNKVGQFTASFTVPEPPAGKSASYAATVGVVFNSELGPFAIKSAPALFLMTTSDRGVLFSVRFIPETDQFFINNDGILG